MGNQCTNERDEKYKIECIPTGHDCPCAGTCVVRKQCTSVDLPDELVGRLSDKLNRPKSQSFDGIVKGNSFELKTPRGRTIEESVVLT